MLRGEDPCAFVKRVFSCTFEDLSPKSLDAARTFFHPNFVHEADGRCMDFDEFLTVISAHKRRRVDVHFSWKNLQASPKQSAGVIHVMSVHSSALKLHDGMSMLRHGIAMLQIDTASGQLVHCDELTRMEQTAPEAALPAPFSAPMDGTDTEAAQMAALKPGLLLESGSLSYDSTMATFDAEWAASTIPLPSVPEVMLKTRGACQAGAPLFTIADLESVRAECFADDVPISPRMQSWSREAACAFFESGGNELPPLL